MEDPPLKKRPLVDIGIEAIQLEIHMQGILITHSFSKA